MQTGGVSDKQQSNKGVDGSGWLSQDSTCLRCSAWYGELGLEPTPEQFVENMVAVFREVKRVLRSDGTCFLNLGDSYYRNPARGNQEKGGHAGLHSGRSAAGAMQRRANHIDGLKEKDLVGIPWMVAFALRADGWWLRSDIIWAKPNPMPESVTDRPTKAHEYLFLLSLSLIHI